MLLLAALAAGALHASPAHAAKPLTTGFYDAAFGEGPEWLLRAQTLQAGMIRTHVEWSDIAPEALPDGFDATDPAAPGYRWASTDRSVRALAAGGFSIILSFDTAPAWAEGPNRRKSAGPGTWQPDPAAVGRFGQALARRYGGSFPDPDAPGSTLPRVRAFQLWNEPNLDTYLAPQWRKVRGAYRPFAPGHYRRMLKAFQAGVKASAPGALVATGGTSPFGDASAGASRMQPVRFLRELLCVRARLRRRSCNDRVAVDVVAHHPYSVGRPRRRALNPDDASIPDLGKLRRVIDAAKRLGRLRGARPRLWVTEVSYDSRPPDPDGVPIARHARWAEEALYLLWKQGASVVVWLSIRDQLPEPSYSTTIQAGPYFHDGRAKPAARAFRFPLVAERVSAGRVRVWGRSPLAGPLVVERRAGSRWRTVVRLTARARGTFLRTIALRGSARLRARVGDETSLTWSQG
jgi:hypothetical protein